MRRWLGIAILVIIALGWRGASAQSRGDIELGLDGGVGMAVFDRETFITVGFPVQSLRIGWFAGDRTEIEPSVAFHRSWASSGASPEIDEQAGVAELAVSYHGGGTGKAGRGFVKGGGLVLLAGDEPIESQFGVEAGFGWKQRFDPHWALRIELTVARTFDSGALEGGWLPALTFGFSHFSKPK